MPATVTIEIPADSERLVRRVLALRDELTALALSAPDGTVLDACEEVVVPRTREVARQVLAEAVARRVETAEKKGRRSASAGVGGRRRTAGGPAASSSPASGC